MKEIHSLKLVKHGDILLFNMENIDDETAEIVHEKSIFIVQIGGGNRLRGLWIFQNRVNSTDLSFNSEACGPDGCFRFYGKRVAINKIAINTKQLFEKIYNREIGLCHSLSMINKEDIVLLNYQGEDPTHNTHSDDEPENVLFLERLESYEYNTYFRGFIISSMGNMKLSNMNLKTACDENERFFGWEVRKAKLTVPELWKELVG